MIFVYYYWYSVCIISSFMSDFLNIATPLSVLLLLSMAILFVHVSVYYKLTISSESLFKKKFKTPRKLNQNKATSFYLSFTYFLLNSL